MSNIAKASDFSAPTISGSVKVSLAEIDKLRIDYARAVQTIQELQDRQMQVKVILSEPTGTYVKDDYGRTLYEKRKETIEYKNLAEVKEAMKEEVDKKWQNSFNQLKIKSDQIIKEKEELLTGLQEHIKDVTQKTDQYDKLVLENSEIKGANQELEGKLYATITDLEVSKTKIGHLYGVIHTLKVRRSFWYWFTGLFCDPEKTL